jgi:hypothetical protein
MFGLDVLYKDNTRSGGSMRRSEESKIQVRIVLNRVSAADIGLLTGLWASVMDWHPLWSFPLIYSDGTFPIRNIRRLLRAPLRSPRTTCFS